MKLKGFSWNTVAVCEPQHVLLPAAQDLWKFSVPLQVAGNLGVAVPPLLGQLIGFLAGVYVKAAYKAGKYGHCKEFGEEIAAKAKKK